jgi:sialate O-acetylesterase
MHTHSRAALLGGLLAASLTLGQAAVKLPPVLANHMVLQQGMPVPIWGTAEPNEGVAVKFRGQEKKTAADAQGKWLVKLDPLTAGGPDDLMVTGTNTLTLTNVLVGEVWVGSGQSNMAGGVGGYTKGDETLAKLHAAAPYPTLRLGTARGWQEATPAACNGYSAQLFAFGVYLQQTLKVPVGLLHGSVGGTPSGYWLSENAYRTDAACTAVVEGYAKANPYDQAKEEAKYQAALQKYDVDKAAWDALSDEEKKTKRAPGKPNMATKPGESNGKIGNLYEALIRPMIPFAIRGVLWDQGESGTNIVGVDQFTLMGALIRGWRTEWGQGEFPFVYVQKHSGGGCAFDPTDPVTINASKFSALPAAVPTDGGYRETHIRIMTYPNVGMAISSDLGAGIHPTNKSGYANRDARVALGMAYGQKLEYYGPLFQSQTVDGAKVRVKFTHIGQGLAIPAGQEKLQGFAIAGEDKKFVWADAVIDGETIVLSSAAVTTPLYVRYAWANNAPWANLFNKDGLPAIPFRTDK